MTRLEKIKAQRNVNLPFLKLESNKEYKIIFQSEYEDILKYQDGSANLRDIKPEDDKEKIKNFYRFIISFNTSLYRLDADQNLAEKIYEVSDEVTNKTLIISFTKGKGYTPRSYKVTVDKQNIDNTITRKETNDDSNNIKAISDTSELPNITREVNRREATVNQVATQQQPEGESRKQPEIPQAQRKEPQGIKSDDGRIDEAIRNYSMSNLKVTMDMIRGIADYVKEQHKGDSNKAVREEMISEWILKQASLDEESAKWVRNQPWVSLTPPEIQLLHRFAKKTLGPVMERQQVQMTSDDALVSRGCMCIHQGKNLESEFTKDELNYIKENYESLRMRSSHKNNFAFLIKVMNLGKETQEVVKEVIVEKEVEVKKEEFSDLDIDSLTDEQLFKEGN
jgi:hypothetical protein